MTQKSIDKLKQKTTLPLYLTSIRVADYKRYLLLTSENKICFLNIIKNWCDIEIEFLNNKNNNK